MLIKDGDSGVTLSSPNIVAAQQPVKKPTRQWAAWTRQEEESFFNALRQVGKNFEKITYCVQSKNKDQVRHYYYRLVRRMNKLLGPGLSLDAKNSKDTIAAMLRWWSLLEKYSCQASKLHLKPRRFKIFIEALEHQLSKDHRKNIRKRPSHGDNFLSASSTTLPNDIIGPVNDTHSVKLILVDSQNVHKVGSVKGCSSKRNANIAITHSNNKGDSSAVKIAKQRRKPGSVSPTAYKRWEKAATAGVSLVADAAEHLESLLVDKRDNPDNGALNVSFYRSVVPKIGQEGIKSAGKILLPSSTSSECQDLENSSQCSTKLKLQLFPMDEETRRALEKDNHNPHLELTLSARKKISSVLEHLNRKWGSSSIASGEIMLFPYSVQREKLVSYQRWTQETVASAADVYAIIGSPIIFRLRYGWFSKTEFESEKFQRTSVFHIQEEHTNMDILNGKEQFVDPITNLAGPTIQNCIEPSKDQLKLIRENTRHMTSYTDFHDEMIGHVDTCPANNLLVSSERAENSSWLRMESGNGEQWEDMDNQRSSNCTKLSACEWADSLTNISVGALLSEPSHNMDNTCIYPPAVGSSQCDQQLPFSCDSFDVAIAAHISIHQDKTRQQSTQISLGSSIWDAEQTCDAFSFQKIQVLKQGLPRSSGITCLGPTKEKTSTSCMDLWGFDEVLPEVGQTNDPACERDLNNCQPDAKNTDESAKTLSELRDIYWPDSLGPLDLDVPSSRYHSEDPILSDSTSLSGLSRLIASSLDAFQNCSFFGLGKKEPLPTVETMGNFRL